MKLPLSKPPQLNRILSGLLLSTIFISPYVFAADSDGDGIADGSDNCPNAANQWQNDMDNDGIGSSCDDDIDGDGYLNEYEKAANTDPWWAKSIPNDNDNDWVPNVVDNCPNTANQWQNDMDNDGIGSSCDDDIDGDGYLNKYEKAANTDPWWAKSIPSDNDNDFVPNIVDNCLDTANQGQWDKDQDGIGNECDSDVDGDGYGNNIEEALGSKVWDATSNLDIDNFTVTNVHGDDFLFQLNWTDRALFSGYKIQYSYGRLDGGGEQREEWVDNRNNWKVRLPSNAANGQVTFKLIAEPTTYYFPVAEVKGGLSASLPDATIVEAYQNSPSCEIHVKVNIPSLNFDLVDKIAITYWYRKADKDSNSAVQTNFNVTQQNDTYIFNLCNYTQNSVLVDGVYNIQVQTKSYDRALRKNSVSPASKDVKYTFSLNNTTPEEPELPEEPETPVVPEQPEKPEPTHTKYRKVTYIHTDLLGSPVAETDEEGNLQ